MTAEEYRQAMDDIRIDLESSVFNLQKYLNSIRDFTELQKKLKQTQEIQESRT